MFAFAVENLLSTWFTGARLINDLLGRFMRPLFFISEQSLHVAEC